MKKLAIAGIIAVLALVVGRLAIRLGTKWTEAEPPPVIAPSPAEAAGVHPSFLYGRIETVDGAVYEGRLRWGRVEEAFWGNYFNGAKRNNPWVEYLPDEMRKERDPIKIFGLEIASRERPIDVSRLFMARFGDIARIEGGLRDVRVTLKSGTAIDLIRSEASDFDDGVRVWDRKRGVTDLDSLRIRAIDLLPAPAEGAVSDQLNGAVRTRQGRTFSGFIQWDREQGSGADEFVGHSGKDEIRLRFGAIGSIARRSRDSFVATRLDGSEITLSGERALWHGNRGIYVDDLRYGRVLVSRDAFERIEFGRSGGGPAYEDFPPVGPLTGSIVAGDGRRIAGRLVYDLDESEFTDTLDAPAGGVDYTIPFGLIASIVPGCGGEPAVKVTLHSGEALELECSGDLGPRNAGMLVFEDGRERPVYLRWTEIQQIALDRPPAMYPPIGKR